MVSSDPADSAPADSGKPGSIKANSVSSVSAASVTGKVMRLIVLIASPLIAAAGFLYIFVFDPNVQARLYIPCFFHLTTGLYCPGCGNTRALHALVHLDFPGVLENNILFPVTFFILTWLLAGEYLNLLLGKRVLWLPKRVPAILIIIGCILMIAFVILRNVPVYPFTILAPGP